MPRADSHKQPFFGSFPRRGIWNALGLTRGQFLAILGISVIMFLLLGGPLWANLRAGHLTRIVLSYAFIPVAVWAALLYNGRARVGLWLGGSVVLAIAKLVLTALLVVFFGLAAR